MRVPFGPLNTLDFLEFRDISRLGLNHVVTNTVDGVAMDMTLPALRSEDSRAASIPVLVPRDDPRLDPTPMAHLFAERGEVAAELVIGRAMDELAERVTQVDALYRDCRFGDLGRVSKSIVAIAEGIGFLGVAQAARQVAECAENRDPTALSSTVARLLRLAEQSLSAVWDFEPYSPDPGVGS